MENVDKLEETGVLPSLDSFLKENKLSSIKENLESLSIDVIDDLLECQSSDLAGIANTLQQSLRTNTNGQYPKMDQLFCTVTNNKKSTNFIGQQISNLEQSQKVCTQAIQENKKIIYQSFSDRCDQLVRQCRLFIQKKCDQLSEQQKILDSYQQQLLQTAEHCINHLYVSDNNMITEHKKQILGEINPAKKLSHVAVYFDLKQISRVIDNCIFISEEELHPPTLTQIAQTNKMCQIQWKLHETNETIKNLITSWKVFGYSHSNDHNYDENDEKNDKNIEQIVFEKDFDGNSIDYFEIEFSQYRKYPIFICVQINLSPPYSFPLSSKLCVIPSYECKFTNLGSVGRFGPKSLENCYVNEPHEHHVKLQNGIQIWTVPYDGKYHISAYGASGGYNRDGVNSTSQPGKGAQIEGDFDLVKGTSISVLVGQMGTNGKDGGAVGAGGGGGSFAVLSDDNTPLIIAAGGNGANWCEWKTNGANGSGDVTKGRSFKNGADSSGCAGRGGSFHEQDMHNWNVTDSCFHKCNGSSFINGAYGGPRYYQYCGDGGFGSGGGSHCEGGGGGGFIGGSPSHSNEFDKEFENYGAYSYNSSLYKKSKINKSGVNERDGFIIISYICT